MTRCGGTGDDDVPITHSIRSCSNAALAIAQICTAQCREPGHSSLALDHGSTMPKSCGCRCMTEAPFKKENPDRLQDGACQDLHLWAMFLSVAQSLPITPLQNLTSILHTLSFGFYIDWIRYSHKVHKTNPKKKRRFL